MKRITLSAVLFSVAMAAASQAQPVCGLFGLEDCQAPSTMTEEAAREHKGELRAEIMGWYEANLRAEHEAYRAATPGANIAQIRGFIRVLRSAHQDLFASETISDETAAYSRFRLQVHRSANAPVLDELDAAVDTYLAARQAFREETGTRGVSLRTYVPYRNSQNALRRAVARASQGIDFVVGGEPPAAD